MNSVRIVADSGCDLSPTLLDQYQITLVPVLVRFGQEVIASNDLSNEEFWARFARTAQIPGTTSPPPGAFQRAFQQLVDAGHDVVCLTLPCKHSGTYNAAWLAAQEFGERVRVVDTGSFSLGMGVQVLAAAKDAMAGRSAEAIQGMIEGLRARTSVIFGLDTLEWVRRGGRLDRIMPLIDKVASALRIKPIVEMCNGEFRLVAITRSTKGMLQRMEDEVRSRLPVEAVAAVYTRGREVATELVTRLYEYLHLAPADVLCVEAGPAFAAHAGPNALGAIVVRA